MKPPVGASAHRYHFKVFALDAPLPTMVGANRDVLLAAMSGHVVAKGEIVGSYAQSSAPVKK